MRRLSNREEAEMQGFVVDSHCYPWFAYKGPRFQPREGHLIFTDTESLMFETLCYIRDNHEGDGVIDAMVNETIAKVDGK